MAVVPTVTCDCPGKHLGEPKHYHVVLPDGRRWNTDRCDNHASALLRLIEQGTGRWVEEDDATRHRRVFQKTDPSSLV